MDFAHPFYFLRHGETTWNAAGWTQGQLDSPLSQRGREQARRAADILAAEPIRRIVASPLSRARHTAQAVAARLGLPVAFDARLMEVHLGEKQGTPHDRWIDDFWQDGFDPPGGETFAQFRERVWDAMAAVVADGGPGTLIVAHGGLWKAARRKVTIEPDIEHMPNALPLSITPAGGRWDYHILGA